MVKPKFDSTGSLIQDVGEQLLLDSEWVKVGTTTLCECEGADNTKECECSCSPCFPL